MQRHVVVDGSNLATEGRPHPSLAQLNEAVLAYMAEHPDALITVVVDATFGHRIDPKEVAEFDAAVANNELVAPPAGAIGRGDAFLLAVANRVGAIVLSNDSFQEFHGKYTWLFDEGRLVGGKPVPHVGWVFVDRAPVRGPVSRSAVKKARQDRDGAAPSTVRVGSADASKPMPVPTSPPPGPVKGRKRAAAAVPAAAAAAATPAPPSESPARSSKVAAVAPAAAVPDAGAAKGSPTTVNEPGPFLAFVAHHPLGTSVNAVVENYSSHGAYVRVGEVRGYVPLRLMADPAPRSAREFMKIGDAVTLVVESFAPERRSIDLAAPGMASHRTPEPAEAEPAAEQTAPAKRSRAKKAAPAVPADAAPAPAEQAPAEPPKRTRAKRAQAPVEVVAEPVVEAEPPTPVPAKRSRAKRAPAADAAASPVEQPVEPSADEPSAAEPAVPAKRSRAKRAPAAPADVPAPEPAAAAPATARRRRSR
jgi:hypothetical protein